MKKAKRNMLALLLIALACAGYGFYLYKKKPADVRKEKAEFSIGAAELVAAFNADEAAANKKFVDHVLGVSGKVTGIKTDSSGQATVFLDSGDMLSAVTCSFYKEETPSLAAVKQGQLVTIKGQCTGKLMDVVLNKCSIIQ
ncbi:MAG: hypothetical protein KGO82_13240 [Bacteroidota bacterium]|nr:hypothetical protein [Bacteroidota bacterium]